ncbi:maleylpyruvate isomerase family mycothiol-dependent enzyme [Pseudonocardia eucalypti]|uniref:Maleylpyruvate isomerase family mycothiol-dependent enzyme n=1 Tax=Pseudonocardia eucalypti TaxID=648755 RepID=A0ABP9QL78_9PSEU|nr:maleylpyruvate isomerase [Pseudonocardia eucalypti]
MTIPAKEQTIDWARQGTALVLDALDGLDDADLKAPCALPGWTRGHLLAHLAGNAEALGRLVSWARTGVESRMYASAGQRDADIESGAAMAGPELRAWVRRSAAELAAGLDGLGGAAWDAEVITAQGRTVPATTIPWLRARETCVHLVDLAAGYDFSHLPTEFCVALVGDLATWRGAKGNGPALELAARDAPDRWRVDGAGPAHHVELPVADLAAWLTGRTERPGLPELPRWL